MTKLVLIICITWLSSFSHAVTWVTNSDHSEINFQVPYMGVSEISGRFNDFSGDIQLNEDGFTVEQVEIKIHTDSIDTGNGMRDGHLRGSEFFQSAQYPFIIFKSKNVALIKGGHYKADGAMSIRGVSRFTTIEFSTSNSLKDTWGYENKFVKFESKIKRSDYKLKWNKTLADQKYLVGDEVSFMGVFQIQPSSHLTPTTKHMIPDTSYIRSRERMARGEIQHDNPDVGFDKNMKRPVVPGNTLKNAAMGLPLPMVEDFRENNLWWVSLGVLGLLGFFGVLLVCYYSKNKIAESFPLKYEENGILGYVSDSVVIFMVSVYAVALWFLGWGIR